MVGARVVIQRGRRDDAEKPYWISFADLMSALMVLFLLVMSVALLAVTRAVGDAEAEQAERERGIGQLYSTMERAAAQFPGVTIDRRRNVIDFGDRARFDTGSSRLSPEQEALLRAFVPKVLELSEAGVGRRWLKRIVVEGFADPRGSYLLNLHLSLQRSERVLCALLAPPHGGEAPMSAAELEQIRRLFLAGGYSSNSARRTLEESRRIELRLEFYGIDERRLPELEGDGNFGSCTLS